MRQIKFRAWEKTEGRMMDLATKSYDAFAVCLFHDLILKGKTTFKAGAIKYEYAVMQFTGLRDKNAREIYEGDIVHIEDKRRNPTWGTDENKVIVFDGAAFRFDGMNLAEMMGWAGYPAAAITYEVIGNIYENPELLK